jgi:ATP-dependent exoDNAse (exonuclease V) beta subunit
MYPCLSRQTIPFECTGDPPASQWELHAEVPFAVRLEGDGTPRILHGVIALAFRGPDGWELVDYKTDQADVATLAARYGDQVRLYAAQWTALTGGPVRHAASTRSGSRPGPEAFWSSDRSA